MSPFAKLSFPPSKTLPNPTPKPNPNAVLHHKFYKVKLRSKPNLESRIEVSGGEIGAWVDIVRIMDCS